jgi:sterol desaturase/sphingolipid hydroxylase (fatty acid hydroxylase superfamily)
MTELIFAHEPAIRLGFFLGVFLLMAGWEAAAPRRAQTYHRRSRWPHNLLVVVFGTLAVRVLVPLAAVGAALTAQANGWGLFNQITLPGWLAVALAVLALDVLIYFQHRLFHAVPLLWRLHRMHHIDLEFDVTTGLRFHPVEILLSMGIKLAAVVTLGAPPLAVLIFEVLLNATAMFNHANVRLPLWIDRGLRRIVVTPDMHRVHHSVIVGETNSNFGFSLPWWDWLFRTYRAQPAAGHVGMTIGIEEFRDPRDLRIDRMLLHPLQSVARIAPDDPQLP